MKKTILAGVVSLLALIACSQKISATKVPTAVKSVFNKMYPKVDASWEQEDGNFEASFKEGGKDMSLLINKDGEVLETETGMTVSDLPAQALAYLKANSMAAKDAAKIVKKDGSVVYEAAVKGKDMLFDENGVFLKEVKD